MWALGKTLWKIFHPYNIFSMLYLIVQLSINNDTIIKNDTINIAICRYKPNPFANAVLPYISSFILPPACSFFYIGGYKNMKAKISSHPECEKAYRDEFKATAFCATTGALSGSMAYIMSLAMLIAWALSQWR